MARLAPSLNRLFLEIDARWPNRDRRTDGWLALPSVRISKGHNPDSRGEVHAIDVDRDGIDPLWIINNIYRGGGVLRYIIWDRRVWHTVYGWTGYAYTGKNPHTDHMHIEINFSLAAETYSGHWAIAPGRGFTNIPPSSSVGASDDSRWQYRQHIDATAGNLSTVATSASGHARSIASIRI